MNEYTVELTSVHDVTKDNFDAVVAKLEELYGNTVTAKASGGIWMISPEEQKKKLEEKDTIKLFFLKERLNEADLHKNS